MAREGSERIGRNEASLRHVNEAIETGRRSRDGLVGFVCECSRLGCNEVVQLTIAEYEAIRGHPRRFFVARGHEHPAEDVVEVRERFSVVEKRGEAGDVAKRAQPRVAPDTSG